MNIIFANKKLEKILTDYKEISKKYGIKTKFLINLISKIQASDNFDILKRLREFEPHKLKGNKAYLYSLEIHKNWKMLIKPVDENGEWVDAEKYDNSKITTILIEKIEDYH
jgi:proteic killer suppression protein